MRPAFGSSRLLRPVVESARPPLLRAPRRRYPSAIVTALVFGLAAVARSASAQQATALNHFEPAPAGDAMLWVPSSAAPGRVRPAFAVALDYAHRPLILSDVGSGKTVAAVVDHQLTLHVLASVHLFDRLALDLGVPFTLSQGGDDQFSPSFPSPHGAAVGDVRFGARATVLAASGFWPSASIGATAWLPSGDAGAYAGTGKPRFAPSISVGSEGPRFVWGVSASRRFAPTGGLLGSDISLLAGGAVRFGAFQVGPELAFSTVTDEDDQHAFSPHTTSLEAMAVARARARVLRFTLAAGPGFGREPGTPSVRVLAGAEVSFDAVSPRPPKQTQKHGASDSNGLPLPASALDASAIDTDGDGVVDAQDRCKTVVGPPHGPRPGCPADADGDGLADAVDACPKEPGPVVGDSLRDGCPPDSDGDGVIDTLDACVREKGPVTTDPKTNGCPGLLRVHVGEIALLAPLNFKTASAEIDPGSYPLLEELAAALRANPAISRVAVDGHTDNRGNAAANVLLSQKRAVAVVSWLTAHGIDPRRTEARGFGPHQPVADNGTDTGRAKNRRVELVILKRTPEGEVGWEEGTIERNVDDKPRGALP